MPNRSRCRKKLMESGGGARSGGASLRLTAVYSKNRYASRFHALAAVADSCLSTRLADSQEPGAPTLYAWCHCHAMQLQFLAWPPSCPPIHSPSSPGLGPPLPLLPFYSATSATRYTLQRHRSGRLIYPGFPSSHLLTSGGNKNMQTSQETSLVSE